MKTREAPDFWGLHKNRNCAFRLTLYRNDITSTRNPKCIVNNHF